MNYQVIALATTLGISAPGIIDVAIPQPVLAASYNSTKVNFADKDWIVSLSGE
jgi:hypothetical protein